MDIKELTNKIKHWTATVFPKPYEPDLASSISICIENVKNPCYYDETFEDTVSTLELSEIDVQDLAEGLNHFADSLETPRQYLEDIYEYIYNNREPDLYLTNIIKIYSWLLENPSYRGVPPDYNNLVLCALFVRDQGLFCKVIRTKCQREIKGYSDLMGAGFTRKDIGPPLSWEQIVAQFDLFMNNFQEKHLGSANNIFEELNNRYKQYIQQLETAH